MLLLFSLTHGSIQGCRYFDVVSGFYRSIRQFSDARIRYVHAFAHATMSLPFSLTAWGSRLTAARPIMLTVMLALLLGVLTQAPASALAQALFVMHFGLFILWQPFVEGGQRLSPVALLGLLAALITLTIGLDSRLLMLWIMLLAGVVGGKVMLSGARATRWFYLMALAVLVLALLLLAIPSAFPGATLPPVVTAAANVGLPLILVVMLFLPRATEGTHAAEIVDFVNSVFVFLLLAVIVLGSLAAMLMFSRDYATALFETLLTLGGVLLVMGWIWNPHGGFSGIGDFFSRYLMSIGLPAEQWLQALADHAVRESDPDQFVERALVDMSTRLTWLRAYRWTTLSGQGGAEQTQIEMSGRASAFSHQNVTVTLYTHFALSPTLAWHFQLLVQLLGEFHADKLRAMQLKELSYLQAVHETGARLTHDVKNLLQSLQTLCHAAEEADAENSPEFRALLRRQLPALANRLGATLSKLKEAQEEAPVVLQPVVLWWPELQRRYAHVTWITMDAQGLVTQGSIPASMVSSVVENLLGNAEEKHAKESALKLVLSLRINDTGFHLSVCDDGSAVPPAIAGRLLYAPVPSQNGLGIGLYQVARLAAAAGYSLALAENNAGRVCFRLDGPLSGV